jgi:tetratricopeptide (TPR) repeat protein
VSKLDKRSLTVFTLLILVLSAFSAPALGASLTVETDRESYLDGEHINISGSGNPGDSVSVAVITNSTTVFETTVVVNPEGFYTLTYLLSGAQPGEYVVEARADGDEAEAVFKILGADCRLTRDLLALLSRSREKTRDMLRIGESEHGPEGAFYERYLMAEEAAEEASELFEEGRCQEAAVKATEALRLYGESVKLAREGGEEEPEDDIDEDVERILKLKDALGRAHAYLEKVNRTSREFGESGFNVSGVNSLVDEAVRLLLRAEEMLEEGITEEAEELISEAHRHLNRAMELIRELNEVNKIERARRFLTETKDRLSLMEDRIINMLGNLGVPGHILEAVGAVFQNARIGIEDVKDLLETGNVEEAIDEFKEVFEETEEGLNLVEEFDGNRRSLLNELKRLEARLGYLSEKVEALRRSGVDVSKFSYKFEHAKVLLERAVYKLETGQVALAEELIDEIEDIVEAIEEELEAFLRRLRSETSLSTDAKEDGGDTDEEPETGEPEETDEQILEMMKHLDCLKEEITALMERIEEMREAGYDVLYLVPKMEAAKRMAEAAIDSLEEGEKEPARVITSELEVLLDHVEDALNRILEAGLDDGKTEEETPEKETCDEEALKKFANELDELERELAEVIELYETLGDAGARLKTYVQMAISLFKQLAEMEPCDESTARTMSKLVGLLEYIETEAKIIKESLEPEPERVIQYYALKIGDEVYGKFEWVIVKQVEGEWRMVFEEGVVYDCFVEWILNGVEEVYEPLSGKIVSVDIESMSVIEWYFEGAVPYSIRGELEAATGEPHPMERLELVFSHVEEA